MSRQKKVFALVVGILVAANVLFVTCKQPTSPDKTVPATSITLDDRNGIIMYEGDTATLRYTITPATATKSVTWDSSDKTVIASVLKNEKDNYGTITALKSGTTTITVKTASGKTDTCEVTVIPGGTIEGIALNTETLNLLPGGEATLLSMPIPANAKDKGVTWNSDDESVATVDNGVVKAVKVGTATITVASNVNPTLKAECLVTVALALQNAVAVESVSLDKDDLSFAFNAINTTATLTASLDPSNASNKNVTWYSSNNDVATVTPASVNTLNATVKAIGSGSALIIVTTEDGGKFEICAVTVDGPPVIDDPENPNPPTPVSGVILNITNLILDVDQGATLVATVMPISAAEKRVYWNSTNPGVATVSATGAVEAVSPGTAVITVTTIDGEKIAFCSVRVREPPPPQYIPVSSVTLNTENLTLALEGTATTLVPLVQPPDATNQKVSWASSNSAVARVNADGEVSPVSAGTAIITVTTQDGGFKATCEVKVEAPPPGDIPVEDIILNINTLILQNNGSVQLIATVIPADATNQTYSWKSSNTAVAEVTQLGMVTAKGNGTAAIIVTTADGGKTDICNITIQAAAATPVASVLLNTATLTLTLGTAGAEAKLEALVQPATATNKAVGWATSNPGVATVNADGVVTAVSAGTGTATAIITVTTVDGGKTNTCVVTVREAPAQYIAVSSVRLNITSIMLSATGTADLLSTVVPANATNPAVNWSSSNNSVATVDNGTVRAVAGGTAAIIVTTSDGGKTATCTVTVQVPSSNPVTGVTLDPYLLELSAGETQRLTATVAPSNATNDTIAWSTSNPAVATVNSSGQVTALSEGDANITVTTQDGGYKASCVVKVSGEFIHVESVTLSPKPLTVTRGRTALLSYTILPDDASDKAVTWGTDDPAIAAVTNGTVSGVGIGTTTITVYAQGGKTDTCTVTVVASDVPVTAVMLNTTVLSLIEGEERTLMSVVLPPEAPSGVDWESDAENIASVNNGVVKAVAEGSATITVRSLENKAIYAECAVTVQATPDAVPVTGVTLDETSITLEKFMTKTLVATVAPPTATNKTVQWYSTDPTKVTVNPTSGLVTAVDYGFASIIVTTVNGGHMANCIVTVLDPSGTGGVTGISLDKTSLNDVDMDDGPITLTAIITPSSITNPNIFWQSSNESVAAVSSSGAFTATVTITGPGMAIITAVAGGRAATCTINVLPKYIPIVSFRLARTSVEVKKGGQITLGVIYDPSTTTERAVTWSTDASSIATVSNGVVTGVAPGTTTITATSDFNENLTSSCTVTVTQSTDFNIKFDQIRDQTLTVSGGLELSTSSLTNSITLTLSNAAQYDAGSIKWKVNKPEITGTGATFVLSASQFTAFGWGKYYIALEVYKDGKPYSTTITMELVE